MFLVFFFKDKKVRLPLHVSMFAAVFFRSCHPASCDVSFYLLFPETQAFEFLQAAVEVFQYHLTTSKLV